MTEHGPCACFFYDLLMGVHSPDDTYCLALYSDNMHLTIDTEKYTPRNEVVGQGYDKGGRVLTGFKAIQDNLATILTFDNVKWDAATISANAGLIYNQSAGNKAVAVLDFGGTEMSKNGPFTVEMPAATAKDGLIVITR